MPVLTSCRKRSFTDMISSAYTCTPCGKTFTGPEPYNQHIASEKHKKKIQSGPVFQSGLVCEPCRMSFTGPAPMREHMASTGHAKAMAMHQALMGPASPVEAKSIRLASSSANKSIQSPSTAALREDDVCDGLPDHEETWAIGYLQCHICNIPSFSCANDAFNHYESAEHWNRKQAFDKGIEPSSCRPAAAVLSSLASAGMAEPPPTLPSSVLVCRAEESFEDFCRRNDLSFLF